MTEKSMGEQNFEPFARRYAALADTKPHNAYYERPATLSLLPAVHDRRVLDAGCGPGIYAEWLLDHGARVVAFDVTPEFVAITRERIGDRAPVYQADLTRRLDFAEDESFDLAVCPLVLDYIADWKPIFDEFWRVLVPGGALVFSCGHPTGDILTFPDSHYFATDIIEMRWRGFGEPVPVVRSYRRPLSAILNPLLEARFVLDRVLEPLPTDAFKEADPESYADLMRMPAFLCVRARKPAVTIGAT